MACHRNNLCISWMVYAVLACSAAPSGFVFSREALAADRTLHGQQVTMKKDEDVTKRYHWLFKEGKTEESSDAEKSSGLFDKLDKEIKEARRLYLSGDLENAILKYRSAIDGFESILDDLPQESPLLKELDQRAHIFDELATKILGPLHNEIPEEASSRIFHVMEKRRIVRRNMVIKKLTRLEFFDVPVRLTDQESRLLKDLLQVRQDLPSQEVRQKEESLKSQLTGVRQAIQKASDRYTLLRAGLPISLAEVKKEVLAQEEVLLDINMLPDRIVVGVITKEQSRYYQFSATRTEIDMGVFQLQDKLREFSHGDKATFMGHAWKEPCRRLYRTLFGPLPPLPTGKTTVFIMPDRSLWYLPFSALLDSEDRPFGQDRVVSLIPSGDILKLVRLTPNKQPNKARVEPTLLLFESIPWIPEEQVHQSPASPKSDKKRELNISEEERLDRLILTNPVYPKPSDIVITVQKMFSNFDVWVGPAATVDRFVQRSERREDITILALPLSTWDTVYSDRQPTFFFSPDKRGQRTLMVQQLFSIPRAARAVVFPVAWFNVSDRENPTGEGPLLLNLALFYSGAKLAFYNYSDPNWGGNEPFLMDFLKKSAEKHPIAKTLLEYPRDMPAGLDSSFSGKPPSWAGWILSGDVGIR